jgi:RNA polymerase sigma factor (sigma-70 family)
MRDKTTKVKQRAICGRDELLLVPNSKAAPQRGPTNISKTNFVGFPTPVPIYLKTMTSDLELLKQYARQNSQDAFTALVNRHLNLVYSAALRQVRSPQLAEEVAQSVFTDLARTAGELKPDTILTAWLYQVTRRTAIDVIRRESRRQLREQIASEMNAMNAHAADSGTGFQPVWTDIEPVLDEAMHTLDDTDRAAVLLRYFENKSFREVGQILGTSDDAAQKRVSRAVERLREFFTKRNVTVGASGLVVLISANAVQAAPVGLAATISAAAVLAGTAVSTSTVIAVTKAIAMTTLQKTLITATIAAVAGAGIYEARQASRLREENQSFQQQQAPLAEQVRQLQREYDEMTNRLATLQAENTQLKSSQNSAELLKLRGEVARLQTAANDPTDAAVKTLAEKVNKLKKRLEETPNSKIPELQFITDQDWINAANGRLDNDASYRRALSTLRKAGEGKFATMLNRAVIGYMKNNGGQMPADLAQLQPYFDSPVDDAILQRWEIAPANKVRGLMLGGNSIITQKAPVDDIFDTLYGIGPSGFGTADFLNTEFGNTLEPVNEAYMAAHNGQTGATSVQLLPYATTPEQQAAVQKLIQHDSLVKQAY